MNRWAVFGVALALLAGLALRLPQLDRRPFHTDESVHAAKFLGLWLEGAYRYDPREYHGPFLSYATLPFAWLSGAQTAPELKESTLRGVAVLFGAVLIGLTWLLRPGLGSTGTVAAAAWTALSPSLVYYSRYYIHEQLLVAATMLFLAACWRGWRMPHWRWAVLAGLGLGLMHATKETFVFVLVAAAVAVGVTELLERRSRTCVRTVADGDARRSSGKTIPAPPVGVGLQDRRFWMLALLALGVAAAVSCLLFTSFFTHAAGPLDSVRTYLPWFSRAAGESPHLHPWTFYLERLAWFHAPGGPIWSELAILVLAAIGGGAALAGRLPGTVDRRLARFLALYSVVLAIVYSAIRYKTPWCVLGFHHGWVLIAGVGVAVLVDGCGVRSGARWAIGLVVLVAAAHLGWQAWRAAFVYPADRRNPWVYAHTSPDLLRLVQRIQAIAEANGRPADMVLKIMAPQGDYWPLPWYLRAFPASNLGWYPQVPADPYSSMMVVGTKFQANLDEKSSKRWLMVGLFEHRPGVFFELYVAFDIWKRYIESLPPQRDEE